MLACAGHSLDLSRPRVMGILNTTPDSFSDGGELYRAGQVSLDAVRRRAEAMLADGADLLDVGGESTRPGAEPVSEAEELDRVVPVVELLVREFDALVSVDTSTAAVMRDTAAAGAGLINDVRALTRDGALQAAAASGLPVCLMHMQGTPQTMQNDPSYDDVVGQVRSWLLQRVDACTAAGIERDRLMLDPGFGFGKTLRHNLLLLRNLDQLAETGLPVLVGLSRKSMIGKLLDRETDQRVPASLALAVLAVERGACIVRTHDVGATADALAMCQALVSLGET